MLFMLSLVMFGKFGGMTADGFYDAFLRAVDAQEKKLTISVFFAEWLFALTAPLLGTFLSVFLSSHDATF